jgi:hypothetical protein
MSIVLRALVAASMAAALWIDINLPLNRSPGASNAMAADASRPKTTKTATSGGSWSAPVSLGVIGVHAALLADGDVLFWQWDQPMGSGTGSLGVVWNPTTNVITQANYPFKLDVFCSGNVQLPNGQILVTGGKDDASGADAGIVQANLFSGLSEIWTQIPNMNYARWYPTNVELSDGTTLVISGDDQNKNIVLQMEEYNYLTNSWTVLPSSANISPEQDYYPRVVLLPSGKLFMGGFYQNTSIFNPTTNTWSPLGKLEWGTRAYGAMVLLPGLQKVIEAGGRKVRTQSDGTATNTVEEIDFSQPNPNWTYIAPMNFARQNENLVLLPDGTVLAVGGGTGGGPFANPVYQPEVYNPTNNTWTLMNPQLGNRTYHSTALLLPDGRVVSAGTNIGTYNTYYEVFSPSYLSSGARPTITSAPTNVYYNTSFSVSTPNAANISRVALIKLGTTTHATRFDERFVDLTFKAGNGTISAAAPSGGTIAPPGYYMLDLLNSSGVPAVMPILNLSAK